MSVPFLDAKKLRKRIANEVEKHNPQSNPIDAADPIETSKTEDDLKILDYPDRRLSKTASFCDYTPQHTEDALRMFSLHYRTENCAALAATQLSFSHPLAITVIDFSGEKNMPLCLINPIISEMTGTQKSSEGCMSVYPDEISAPVKRAQQIKVEALDIDGNPISFYAEEFLAKCIQHEVDHLHGKLFLSHLNKIHLHRLSPKIERARKQSK